MTNGSDTQIYSLSAAVGFKGMQGHLPRATLLCLRGFALFTRLSCRSLLCAGGPLPPAEEAGLLPHPDLHPSHNDRGAITGLILDQQGVCPCTHCRRYFPSSTRQSSSGALLLHDVTINTTKEVYGHESFFQASPQC